MIITSNTLIRVLIQLKHTTPFYGLSNAMMTMIKKPLPYVGISHGFLLLSIM